MSDIQKRCLSINNKTDKEPVRLETNPVKISPFDPNNAYKHHPFVTYFKGNFFAIWSQGDLHEDDIGQHVMLSKSADFKSWSEPEPLVDRIMGQDTELVLTADGFANDGENLCVYYFAYEYLKETVQPDGHRPLAENMKTTKTKGYVIYTRDGKNWSQPQEMPPVPNMGPRPLKSGRLLKTGAPTFGYTDDKTGLSGWKLSYISNEDKQAALDEGIKCLCEGCFYQTDDSIIHCMIRTDTENLYCSESNDDGESWSRPFKTEFTNDSSKTFFGRLPDGRFIFIGTFPPVKTRFPLKLCVSNDGYNFDKHYILRDEEQKIQQKGIYKGGTYGYPCACVKDNMLYIIYTVQKEQVEVCSVSLDDI